MSFTEQLRNQCRELWESNIRHPFVQAIGRGDLDSGKFTFFLAQDYVFLVEYCRFIAIGTAKAPDLATMRKLAALLEATLNTEMDLHRTVCARFGLSAADLEKTRPHPNCLGYTSYLLSVAYQGDGDDFMAALLPCMWGYAEIGERLMAQGLPEPVHYREWIQAYASREFHDLANWARAWLDQRAGSFSEEKRARLTEIFRNCLMWEYQFWEMAWGG